MPQADYQVASWFLSKSLALSYFLAFLSLLPQALGLFGSQGLLSIDHLLNILDKELGAERFYHLPSVFWFFSGDSAIRGLCFLGMIASTLAFIGFSQSWMFLFCWLFYLSFVSCGQIFLGYQWDSLLLEFGFIGLFMAPWNWEWIPMGAHVLNPLILGCCWLLLFKLMFSSGIVKFTHKDPSWKNLTAMNYHYWTQPLPNPVAYFLHKSPEWVHKFSQLLLLFIELIVPFFIFFPGQIQVIAAALLILLQVLIFLTGNFAFFNIITVGLTFSIVPDNFWLLPMKSYLAPEMFSQEFSFGLLLVLTCANLFWLFKTTFEKSKVLDFLLPSMRVIYPFRISNPYGLFAVMTKHRPEIIMEGSNDGQNWMEYGFRYKPSLLTKSSPVVAPHQPRLDWQLWFASLERFEENLWLQNLIVRVFAESRDVQSILGEDPFGGKSPKYLRLLRYEYTFSDFKTLREKKQWWDRRLIEYYSPIFERDDFIE